MARSLLAATVLALAAAAVTARMPYVLPADSELILSNPIQTTFSCVDKPYGYYADIDNNCELFHVCFPIGDEIGALVETAHFTFVCGNVTVFSQETLSCVHRADAFPCSESQTLYELSNAEFGRIPDYEEFGIEARR